MASNLPDASIITEIALFASTLVSNVCIYMLQMNTGYTHKYKYSFCKFYSLYGHNTIFNYLKNHGAKFYSTLDVAEILERKSLSESVRTVISEIPKGYVDSDFYEACVKTVLIDIYASHNKVGFKDDAFDVIGIATFLAFRKGILKENYDYKRYICASILNVIYQKLGYNFKDYLENDEKCNFALSAFTIDLIGRMKEALWDNLEERAKIKGMKYFEFYETYGLCKKYIKPGEKVNKIHLLTMTGMYLTICNFQNRSYKATKLIDYLTRLA